MRGKLDSSMCKCAQCALMYYGLYHLIIEISHLLLGTIHILHHHVRGVGGPGTNDDIDDALRVGWRGLSQNDGVLTL